MKDLSNLKVGDTVLISGGGLRFNRKTGSKISDAKKIEEVNAKNLKEKSARAITNVSYNYLLNLSQKKLDQILETLKL